MRLGVRGGGDGARELGADWSRQEGSDGDKEDEDEASDRRSSVLAAAREKERGASSSSRHFELERNRILLGSQLNCGNENLCPPLARGNRKRKKE